jgi:hypothetical protein
MDAHDDERLLEKILSEAGPATANTMPRSEKAPALGTDAAMDTDAAEPGVDPVQSLLNQRHPRIRLHRETLNLLQRVGAINGHHGVHDFCNEAIRYVILSREAGTVTFTDLHAVSAAMDARLDELSVILLRLHQSVGDLTLIVEHERIIGAYGERLKRLAEK